MTAGGFSEVDHDLLAEYAGGALEPAQAAPVERLLRDDPRWQRAYRETVVALEAVTAQLAAYGAAAPPMPPEVLARLTGALTAETAGAEPGGAASTGAEPGGTAPAGAEAEATDRGGRQLPMPRPRAGARNEAAAGDRRPARGPAGRDDVRRRRWVRLSAPVAVAAVALVVAGLGLGQWRAPDRETSRPADAAAQVAPPAAGRLIASGRDYTAATLPLGTAPGKVIGPPSAGAPVGPETAGGAEPSVGVQTFASPLDRLRGPDALSACLSAVAAAHDSGPVSVGTVDYATFEGTPAVIVELTDGRGERWAYAAGAGCGLGSDADIRLHARVG